MSAWYMCDREAGEWCDDCFALHPCGQGKHGEGCPTVVFDDEIALVAGAEAVIKAREAAVRDPHDAFREDLAALGAPAPWRLDDEEVGSILHAEGAAVLTIDVNRELDDETVGLLCLAVVTAVNTCTGFEAKIVKEGEGP